MEHQSFPFRGKTGGKRRPKKDRAKLTKVQKKALKWAKKHPEPQSVSPDTGGELFHSGIVSPASATGVIANYVINSSATTTATLGPAVTGAWYGNGTATMATNEPTTIWTSWIDTTDTTGYSPTCDHRTWRGWLNNDSGTAVTGQREHECIYRTDVTWRTMLGSGDEADLYYNPNDRVQQARIARERRIQDEAEYQRRRMERAARDAEERRRWEAEAAERRQRVAAARARSYELLHRHLTDEQKNMLESEDRFLVVAQSGKVYEIRRGIYQNVYLLDERGRAVEQLCCLPRGGVPEGDVMLGQMLHLMAGEEHFRSIANRWELRDVRGAQLDRRLPLNSGAAAMDRHAA